MMKRYESTRLETFRYHDARLQIVSWMGDALVLVLRGVLKAAAADGMGAVSVPEVRIRLDKAAILGVALWPVETRDAQGRVAEELPERTVDPSEGWKLLRAEQGYGYVQALEQAGRIGPGGIHGAADVRRRHAQLDRAVAAMAVL